MIQIQSIKSKYQPIGQTITSNMFTPFNTDDVVSNNNEIVTSTVWSNGLPSLTTHFTSSTQTTSQRQYYVDVANSLPGSSDSAIQYSVAYGDLRGSGSNSFGQLSDSPSKAIYSQYRQLLFPTTPKFQFGSLDNTTGDYIYAITFKRNRMKERLNPGNIEIPLTSITSRDTNASGSVAVGSSIFTFIDDSTIKAPTVGAMGRVYNLVSGSVSNGVFGTTPTYYGKVYPDYGVVIFDGKTLDTSGVGMKTITGSSAENNNHFTMYRSISGSGALGSGFFARNSEKITSTHYFIRVKNTQYNFTTNPSMIITGSTTATMLPDFQGNPITYITTVGLYNDSNQLVAVAKLSKPIQKSYSKEALIRVKLDF